MKPGFDVLVSKGCVRPRFDLIFYGATSKRKKTKMASCLASNLTAADCGGKGTPCLIDSSGKFTCTCIDNYLGFAEFNPEPNNCDVYIPALYVLGSLIFLIDAAILGLVYWAVKVRTIPQFILLLRKKNAPAVMTVTAFFTAFAQTTWVAFRFSDIRGRAIGVDAATTISFGCLCFCYTLLLLTS